FLFYRSGDHPHLHSFPTRRSSDLSLPRLGGGGIGVRGTPCSRIPDPRHVSARSLSCRAARSVQPASRSPRLAHPPDQSVDLPIRSEEHTSELQSRGHLVCRLLLEK